MYQKLLLLFAFVCVMALTSCSAKGTPPPSPPNDLEVTANLQDFRVTNQQAVSTIDLTIATTVKKAEPVSSKLFVNRYSEEAYVQLYSQTILNEQVNVGESKQLAEIVTLPRYGQYQIMIDTEYGGFGKSNQFLVQFTENGVTIERR